MRVINRRFFFAAIVCLLLAGCASKPEHVVAEKPTGPPQFTVLNLTAHWEAYNPGFKAQAWRLVRSDSRVLAAVWRVESDGKDAAWQVFVNGGGYGEFIELDAAKKRAESVATDRGDFIGKGSKQ